MKESRFLRGAIWNTLGSIMYGANSFIMLLCVSRYGSVEEAGDFGITFTTAQILYIIGLLGISHYQQTDYSAKYLFAHYRRAKMYSCSLMWLGCIASIIVLRFSGMKALYIVLLTVLMMLNDIGDLYQSQFFQKNRLDLSGAALFFRTLWPLLVFCIFDIMFKNVVVAILMQIVLNLCVTLYYRVKYVSFFIQMELPYETMRDKNQHKIRSKDIHAKSVLLIKECFPLFVSIFLVNVIINISKYSVELQLNDIAQGYYNMLFIIVQVINLCSQFIYKPLLSQFAEIIERADYRYFMKKLLFQFGLITTFAVAASFIIYIIGPEILGAAYSKDITAYRMAMIYIVIGGAFFAMTMLMYYIFVIMREQKKIMSIYLIGLLYSIALSYILVRNSGLDGAAVSTIISQMFILISYVIILLCKIRKGIVDDNN